MGIIGSRPLTGRVMYQVSLTPIFMRDGDTHMTQRVCSREANLVLARCQYKTGRVTTTLLRLSPVYHPSRCEPVSTCACHVQYHICSTEVRVFSALDHTLSHYIPELIYLE